MESGHSSQTISNIGNRYESSTINTTQIINSPNKPTAIDNLDFELPYLSKYPVTGRDEDMKKLEVLFKEKKTVAIWALGGTGKTTLAIHCARTWRSEAKNNNEVYSCFRNIAYFMVETRENFKQSVERLANKLNIKKEQSILEKIKDIIRLYKSAGILIILDNLVKLQDVQELLNIEEEEKKNILVLATSQNRELQEHFHLYHLESLKEKEAIDLMLSIFELDIEKEEEQVRPALLSKLKDLHEMVGGLPLTLSHAASWIKNKHIGEARLRPSQKTITSYTNLVEQYLKEFNLKLLKEDFPDQFRTTITKSTFLALKLNIEKCTKSESRKLLYFISFLASDGIILKPFKSIFNEDDLNIALIELTKYSLISTHEKSNSEILLNVHRIVQGVARKYLESERDGKLALLILTFSSYDSIAWQIPHIIKKINEEISVNDVLNLCVSEELKSCIDYIFSETHMDLQELEELEEAECKIDNCLNWPTAHKYLLLVRVNIEDKLLIPILQRMITDDLLYSANADDNITLHHIVAVKNTNERECFFKFLQKQGIDINVPTISNHITPLHVAAIYPAAMLDIKDMVILGANPYMKKSNGESTLDLIDKGRPKGFSYATLLSDIYDRFEKREMARRRKSLGCNIQ